MTSSASSLSSSSGVSAVRLAPQQRRRGHRQLHRQQQEQQERQGRTSAGRCITRQQPDAASSSSSRRRKLLPAAVLAVSGALLMLSSNGSNGSSNLRLASSRKLSATTATGIANGNGKGDPPRKLMNGDAAITDHKRQPPSAARRVQNEKISPAISETVHRLAQPFLDDEANIFAFDANDSRPVINTFFAIPEGQSIQKVDAETLAVWKRAWSSAGWNPVSISMC